MRQVQGERGRRSIEALKQVNYDYAYDPIVGNMKPGTEKHDKIVKEVLDRAEASYDVMQRRHEYWKKIDHTLTAYITLDDEEEYVLEKDIRKPVSIVVPYSYATIETILTYWVSVFLENPIFRYRGFTSEDTVGSIMLEKVIELQCIKNKVALNLHTQFRDSLAYGFGASSPYWNSHWGHRTVFDRTSGLKRREPSKLFEGNSLMNIDPYLYLPDPSVPIQDIQKGGFVGWIDKTNYLDLLNTERYDPDMFNAKYVAHIDGHTSILPEDTSGRETKVGGEARNAEISDVTRPIDVTYMYINIIPKEWELGLGEYPEKWLFILAGDEVLLKAQPLNLDHNLYPVTICAPDYDGYSLTPISRLEIIYGLQGILDFLFTSHVANIRKAINDMLIVDPYLINMSDLKKPGPGKLIRTRRAVWGRGVENAVKQLAVTDVTRNHMQDAGIVMDVMQRSSSAVDSLMGIIRGGSERRSATESRDTRMSALSRLAKSTKIASIMTMQDLAYMFASHTQQLMENETYISTAGRFQQELEEEYGFSTGMKVSPMDLLINYDVISHDGTIEAGEFAEVWLQLYQTLSKSPSVAVGFDMVRIFKHLARISGAKNVNEFVRKGGSANIKMKQDEEIEAEVQKGNMRPI